MAEQRFIPWKSPGFIGVVSTLVFVNLIVDWLWFRPTSILSFVVVEAFVLGGIVVVATWVSRQ